MPNRVSAILEGGVEVVAQVNVPKGHPKNPMSKEDIEAKFLRLAVPKIGGAGARGALRRLWRLEDEKDLGELLGLLRVRKGSKA